MRARSLWLLPLLLVFACPDERSGDDLPPGAFTSGPEDDGFDLDGTTTGGVLTTDDAATSTPIDDSGESTGFGELSHELDIRPVWTASCTDSDCHDAMSPQAGLNLAAEDVYDRICNGSHINSGMPYIDCEGGDPQNSYLFRKLEGTQAEQISGGGGLPMPPDGSLPGSTLAMIEAWILQGAPP